MKVLLVITLILSSVSLFLEQLGSLPPFIEILITIIDYAILALIVLELGTEYRRASYKRVYIKRNLGPIIFSILFIGLFVYSKAVLYIYDQRALRSLPTSLIVIRNVFILLRVFSRFSRLSAFLEEIAAHPAQTIIFGFLIVILVGTLFLMMPFTGAAGKGLRFLDALFTATSAVCVTGLIVVDTASAFSIYGKLIILALIQIGGLGIMILSYFTIFILRRSVSIEDKMLISYMLSEKDMTKLAHSLKNIITITFVIEGVGALLLFLGFVRGFEGGVIGAVFAAVFHSISAFCNAGFSTFSDSLEGIRSNPYLVVIFSLLIIFGGISFAVITNLRQSLINRFRRLVRKIPEKMIRVSMNSKVVLAVSGMLLLVATLVFYGLEHGGEMAGYRLGNQYLSSFFQAVTLRTAGFNTVPFSGFRPVTYLAMAAFMFIGGASGSTAGGIKVNTLAVMFAYLFSSVRDKDSVTIYRNSISSSTILRAFLILLFGVTVVVIGTIFLALFEQAPLEHILFEAVSAFGTVGLSAGLTGSLSGPGKLTVIFLMFLGRIGPLTVLAAASLSGRKIRIEYPRGEIAIG
ncbi:MAG: TrkH family potassium uptake protein [Spirochaetales bacterium]|nr:TrkH family potassium uptake protein [Spirochaetales bacterium]